MCGFMTAERWKANFQAQQIGSQLAHFASECKLSDRFAVMCCITSKQTVTTFGSQRFCPSKKLLLNREIGKSNRKSPHFAYIWRCRSHDSQFEFLIFPFMKMFFYANDASEGRSSGRALKPLVDMDDIIWEWWSGARGALWLKNNVNEVYDNVGG